MTQVNEKWTTMVKSLNDEDMKKMADAVIAYCKAKQMTLRDMETAINVNRTTLSNIQNRGLLPTQSNLVAMGSSLDDFKSSPQDWFQWLEDFNKLIAS